MDQTYMKQKPVLPLVVSMALPMTLSMLVNSLYNIVAVSYTHLDADSASYFPLVTEVKSSLRSRLPFFLLLLWKPCSAACMAP